MKVFQNISTWVGLLGNKKEDQQNQKYGRSSPLYNSSWDDSLPHPKTKALNPILAAFSRVSKSKNKMISSKKLLQLARKWQMSAALRRKRISLGRMSGKKGSVYTEEAPVARKGHFAVYTVDGKRFEIPLSYLANGVIRELFTIAEEEFGIPGEGPIVFPLDSSSMEYVMSTIRRGLASEQEKALLLSFTRCSNNVSADMAPACRQISVCG